MTPSTRSETIAIRAATLVSATLIGQQVAGKAVRDALFLSTFDVKYLPVAMITSALLSLAGAVVLASILARRSPARVVPGVFVASGLLLIADWGLTTVFPRAAALAVYLHVSLFGASMISGFWSFFNERFDPYTAKRIISRVAGGGTIGGIAGGLVAWQGASLVSVPAMILVLAASHVLSLGGMIALRQRGPAFSLRGEAVVRPSLRLFAGQPYLQTLAGLVALGAFVSTLLDYLLGVRASSLADPEALLAFFGSLQLAVGVVAFVASALGARLVLGRFGLAATASLTPASVLGFGAVALAVPGLLTATLLRGAESALRASLFRSAYELFYTPLTPAKKRAIKTIVDVGSDRAGAMLGSGLLMVLLHVLHVDPSTTATVVLIVAMVGAAAAVSLGGQLQRGYVASLAESLQSGSVKLDADDVVDATTQKTLAETGVFKDRRALLAEIAAARAADGEVSPISVRSAPDLASLRTTVVPGSAPSGGGSRRSDRLVDAMADLRSGEKRRVRRVLAAHEPLPRALVPLVIDLVAHEELGSDALEALRGVSRSAVGQLVDAMLDPEIDATLRRRLPRVIAAGADSRASDGLIRGLGARGFEVKYRSARALRDLVDADPALAVSADVVHDLALSAIEEARSKRAERGRVERRIDHVFTILSLAYGKEPMRVAARALHGRDARLRGTALEYLDNVLPDRLATALKPILGVPEAPRSSVPRSDRPSGEVLAELLEASGLDAVSFDKD